MADMSDIWWAWVGVGVAMAVAILAYLWFRGKLK
jgi:hypothetical protein